MLRTDCRFFLLHPLISVSGSLTREGAAGFLVALCQQRVPIGRRGGARGKPSPITHMTKCVLTEAVAAATYKLRQLFHAVPPADHNPPWCHFLLVSPSPLSSLSQRQESALDRIINITVATGTNTALLLKDVLRLKGVISSTSCDPPLAAGC